MLRFAAIALVLAFVQVSAGSAVAQQLAYPDVSRELREVRHLLQRPELKKALAYVDRSDAETVQEWLSLCNAYGPQGDEIYRSRLLYKLFRIYGLEQVRIDDARNVIGVRRGRGGGPTVVLNAHHDNVGLWPKDQPIEAFVADGRVWCPAARDDLMGVVQMLTVLRALNAADIRTKGDIWFVGFTGEETLSQGAEHFVRANYPLNLDWRKGDILVQFHGGGGEGVTTGSSNYIHFTQLRIFVPLDRERWAPDAVDALGPIIMRINERLRDPRSVRIDERGSAADEGELPEDILYMNMAMVHGNEIHNGTSDQAWIRFDLRATSEERLLRAHREIREIAADVVRELGEGYSFVYEINQKAGTPGIEGWDKVSNAPTRYALAAAQALYGVRPSVDPTRGCGDCVRAYMGGMPAMSLRGNVIDYGEGGRFAVVRGSSLKSEVRRKSASHDVTESAEIDRLWSGVKHGLVFAVAYAGLDTSATSSENARR